MLLRHTNTGICNAQLDHGLRRSGVDGCRYAQFTFSGHRFVGIANHFAQGIADLMRVDEHVDVELFEAQHHAGGWRRQLQRVGHDVLQRYDHRLRGSRLRVVEQVPNRRARLEGGPICEFERLVGDLVGGRDVFANDRHGIGDCRQVIAQLMREPRGHLTEHPHAFATQQILLHCAQGRSSLDSVALQLLLKLVGISDRFARSPHDAYDVGYGSLAVDQRNEGGVSHQWDATAGGERAQTAGRGTVLEHR
jgi:hypothetical protein